jgi:hypothetical protein
MPSIGSSTIKRAAAHSAMLLAEDAMCRVLHLDQLRMASSAALSATVTGS